MTMLLPGQTADPAELTIAAAALLTRAVSRYRATGTPLDETDIPMQENLLRSALGSGARPITANEAWDELAEHGLIAGVRQEWAPVAEEVRTNAS